ncbi:transporter substrate-binding domain-containing protein [Massilia sp. W12]|uniref:substrate-binding periplasmic protein n=1 Tax=Massilia sp. W12 TaxID=3126507 RepID=UPI0030D4E941
MSLSRITFAAVGLFCASAAFAGADLICYSTAFAPYVIEQDGKISGIDVDVVAEAGRRAGIHVQFRLLPWVRLENEVRNGPMSEVNCAFAYTSNPQRQTYMDFMQEPLKITRYQVFVRKGDFAQWRGVADLQGKRIGLRRGFVVPGEFEAMRKKNSFVVEEVDDDVNNFRKLSLGRIDALVANADVGALVMQQLQLSQVHALSPALVETPTYLVFNKASRMQDKAALLDRSLRKMQEEGVMAKIRAKYLGAGG